MKFNEVLQSLPQYIVEQQADWGMIYDYVVDHVETPLTNSQWDEVGEIYKPHIEDSRY